MLQWHLCTVGSCVLAAQRLDPRMRAYADASAGSDSFRSANLLLVYLNCTTGNMSNELYKRAVRQWQIRDGCDTTVVDHLLPASASLLFTKKGCLTKSDSLEAVEPHKNSRVSEDL